MNDDVTRLSGGEWTAGAVLLLVGVGLAVGNPLLVAAAAVPISLLLAMTVASEPPATLQVHRRFSSGDLALADGAGAVTATTDTDAVATGESVWNGDPGDTLTVRTTFRNTGHEPILDLRAVDGVPEQLPVVDGTNRTCVTLQPGERATLEYDVELVRGSHSFTDPTARVRDQTGATVKTWTPAVAGDAEIHCSPPVEQVPLAEGTDDHVGEVPAEEGAAGIEFYSVREYEPGDPTASIDWRRYASTRELATVEYRAERSTRIVCLVDARETQFRDSQGSTRTAVDLSLDAVRRTFRTLVAAGHPTGVAGLHSAQVTLVRPGTGESTRRRVGALLSATRTSRQGIDVLSTWVPQGPYTRTGIDESLGQLPAVLPDDALVYLFSAFVDDKPTTLVELLRSHGYTVRVVTPDITGGTDSVPARLAALARETRLTEVRATGADVIDWQLDRPLGLVLQELEEVHGR